MRMRNRKRMTGYGTGEKLKFRLLLRNRRNLRFFFQVQFYFSLELGRKFNCTRFSWSLFSRDYAQNCARSILKKKTSFQSIVFDFFFIILFEDSLFRSVVDVACFKRGIQQKSKTTIFMNCHLAITRVKFV